MPKSTTDAKAGARHSTSDQRHMDQAVEHLQQAGANVPGYDKTAKGAELKQLAAAAMESNDIQSAAAVVSQVAALLQGEAWDDDKEGVRQLTAILRQLVAFINSEIASIEQDPVGAVPDYTLMAKAADIPASDSAPVYASVKALADRHLEVKIAFGGPKNGKDAHGEYFSPRTDFATDHFPSPPLLYYHGFDEGGKRMGKPAVIGSPIKRETRGDGHYILYKLRDGKYADLTWDGAMKGAGAASPGTIGHLIRRGLDGELLYWPVAEMSAWDYTDARKQANPYSVATPVLKALYAEEGLTLPADIDALQAPEQAAGDAADGARRVTDQSSIGRMQYAPTGQYAPTETDMTPEEIAQLVAAETAKALKAQQEAAARERTAAEAAAKAEAERTAAAIASEREKWEAEAAKGRRLPDAAGHNARVAPYVRQFADTAKYDAMSVDDLAFMNGLLRAGQKAGRSEGGVSTSALKALAIKVAEDKSEQGDEARRDMKAMIDLDASDAVNAAKANELDHNTQAGFGDEWVGVEYSRRMWERIRAETFVLQKLPSVEIPQGAESITIPLEAADPTWYTVAATTATNGTTGIPDSTVTTSKLATSNKSLTAGKVGARTVYNGELEEDSLIPWAAQLRTQLEKSGAEQMEHMVIDGDTDSSSSTNINSIGGAVATAAIYLNLNGFRKSALVTTTANSRSAGGSLADTDFLATLQLMGNAGLNAKDPTKVDFIIDANVFWAVQKLTSVKTRDVFTQATLENGMFSSIFGYKVYPSYFMHFVSATNPLKANTAGKVDMTTQANNTTGSILAVRWDQWLVGYKRRITIELQRIPAADSTQIVALARIGLAQRDTEASAITYNCAV